MLTDCVAVTLPVRDVDVDADGQPLVVSVTVDTTVPLLVTLSVYVAVGKVVALRSVLAVRDTDTVTDPLFVTLSVPDTDTEPDTDAVRAEEGVTDGLLETTVDTVCDGDCVLHADAENEPLDDRQTVTVAVDKGDREGVTVVEPQPDNVGDIDIVADRVRDPDPERDAELHGDAEKEPLGEPVTLIVAVDSGDTVDVMDGV